MNRKIVPVLLSFLLSGLGQNASRLNRMGYPVKLRSIGDKWMVIMGGFNTIDEARAKALELNRNGLDCYVAETNRPRFPVFIPQKGRW